MVRVLVVDDSRIDRDLVTHILSEREDLEVEAVESGAAALERLQTEPPDIVLTDLVMPEPDGLQLVRSLKAVHPDLPVVLMTSKGNEDIAMEALRAGAASYLPKSAFGPRLREVVEEVIELSEERRTQQELFGSLASSQCEFELGCEPRLVRPLVKHLQNAVMQLGWCDDSTCMQLGIALSEALQNALEHGNLEFSSEAREEGLEAYHRAIEARSRTEPYCHRRIRVEARIDQDAARFVIADDGAGFDPSTLPDPREQNHLELLSGRGVLLMRTFMDEVTFNEKGNVVTMLKRRPPPEDS
ncbi:MAG: response regulator [Planctomycetota bacterium]